jgi:hypothetical protein
MNILGNIMQLHFISDSFYRYVIILCIHQNYSNVKSCLVLMNPRKQLVVVFKLSQYGQIQERGGRG